MACNGFSKLPNYLQLADNGHQTHMFQSIFMTIIVQTVITYIQIFILLFLFQRILYLNDCNEAIKA